MAAIGGPIENVSINGRIFTVAADADTQRKLGGNMLDTGHNGDGTSRILVTKESWGIEGLMLVCDDDRDDQGFIQELNKRPKFSDITITYASGAVWSGSGLVAGDNTFSNLTSTMTVSLKGSGELTRQ